MQLRDFIRQHREELDKIIDRQLGHVPRTASCCCSKNGTDHFHQPKSRGDEERRQWILNDEGLYRWARKEGCKI